MSEANKSNLNNNALKPQHKTDNANTLNNAETNKMESVAFKSAPKNLLILISGGGSNMQAVFDAISQNKLNATVKAVISSKADAQGILKAQSRGIPTFVFALKDFLSSEDRDKQILQVAKQYDIDYILTLGYLGICSKCLVQAYQKKIINIHPSLLPKFGGKGFFGLNVHKAVLDAGEKESGATVHFADEGTDTGEIIMNKKVSVLRSDTPQSLQERVLTAERLLLIDALNSVFNNLN